MSPRRDLGCTVLVAVLGTGFALPAQVPLRSATVPAEADAFSTEPGGYLLSIPGVADDFVLLGDGQWLARGDGTARLSFSAQRLGALDRQLFVVLELGGRLDPGQSGYPPAGSPVTTLLPTAYAPVGPVDPATFAYYTLGSGTMTGLFAFTGARIDVALAGPLQIGAGATNKNVLPGLAADLALTVVTPPTNAAFVPTGPAELRANYAPEVEHCVTHVDDDPAVSGSTARFAFGVPGIASDYVFLPVGQWTERDDGTATLTASLLRQSDYGDGFELQLSCSNRVDPGDAQHPPAGSPVLGLLPSAYAAQGGPIDPSAWRYYRTATGMLTGQGVHDGAVVQIDVVGALQVGVGADGGNTYFGASAELTATILQQPVSGSIAITGNVELVANLATRCVLPPPVVTTGISQSIESVTQDELVYTGTDLGFVVQVAFGPLILGTDQRRWFSGHVRIVDHETLALSIPQGLVPANYPLTFLNVNRISNPCTVDVQAPATITLRTEDDRFAGEMQHFVTHQGSIAGPAFSALVISQSNLPSTAPGIVALSIGNQFTDYLLLDFVMHDPASGVGVVTVLAIPPGYTGIGTVYSQSAVLDTTFFPLQPSDVWSTVY